MRKLAFETAAERKAYYESLETPVDRAARQAQDAVDAAKKTGAPVTPAMTAAAEETAAQAAKSGAEAAGAVDDAAAAVAKKAKPFRLGTAGKVGLGVTALGALGGGAYLLNKRRQAQPSPQKIAGVDSSMVYSAFFSALSEEAGH